MTCHDTTVASGYGDARVFSEIAKVFPELINQNNQSGRNPVLQEEELER